MDGAEGGGGVVRRQPGVVSGAGEAFLEMGGSSVISRGWMMMEGRVEERKSREGKASGAKGVGACSAGCRCQALFSGIKAKPGGSGFDRRFGARFKVPGSNLAGGGKLVGLVTVLVGATSQGSHHRA